MMISTSLVVSLLLTTQVFAAGPRQQFSSCLRTFMNTKLEERVAPAAFETELAAACREQEAAYRTAYIDAATRAGDRRPAAERDANLEVEDLRTNFLELFRGSQPE